MIVTIMQPYFFPYIGYFQLLAGSNIFVLYDDVQYIKGGWINRNRMLFDGKAKWLSFPVSKGSTFARINERKYVADPQVRHGLLRQLEATYHAAPHFNYMYALVEQLFDYDCLNVAKFNGNLVRRLALLLQLDCRIVTASDLAFDKNLTGQQRVIAICQELGASSYVNPIGGAALYDEKSFKEAGIRLRFLQPSIVAYPQFSEKFIPALSILDVLMFNSPDEARALVSRYTIKNREERS